MVEQFKNSKILNALDGTAPAHRIAADIIRCPAGTLAMNGWLSQVRLQPHAIHRCLIFNKDPVTPFLTVVFTLPQNTQQEKSNRIADLKTT